MMIVSLPVTELIRPRQLDSSTDRFDQGDTPDSLSRVC